MIRRVLFAIPLAILVACSGTETTAPSVTQPPISPAISDGAHDGGNPDAFFLFPLVLPTSSYANWTPNGFNKLVSPTLEICPLDVTSVGAVTPATLCKSAAGFPVVIGGADVKKHFRTGSEPTNLPANIEDLVSHYHAQWQLPNPCNIVYRITLKVGDDALGFADVHCVNSLIGLLTVNYKKFGGGVRGKFVQIPVRIENRALCSVPGAGSCTTVTVDPTVPTTVLAPTGAGAPPAGVSFPGGDTGTPPFTLTIEPCTTLGLPGEFGSCFTIDSNLEGELSEFATVFVCDVLTAIQELPHELQHRIHLHRKSNGEISVLPGVQAPLCPTTEVEGFSVGGLVGALAHQDWKTVRQQVFGLLAPKPLYARRINLGAGGLTRGFSDFKFAEDRSIPIVNYASSGWSYQIDGSVDEEETPWYSSGGSLPSTAPAPFGSANASCTLNSAGFNTSWPAATQTFLYARRTFELLGSATVRIGIAIDNDFQLYVDGQLVSGEGDDEDGFVQHEGCPTLDSFTYDVTLAAGSHVVAVRARDRGVSSYFDAKLTFNP